MPNQTNPNSTAFWLSVTAVVISAATFFRYIIMDLIFRPKLSLELSFSPPDNHRVKVYSIDAIGKRHEWHWRYYFAVRVRNDGRAKAENVAVKLTQLQRKMFDKWAPVTEINPDRLLWRLTSEAYEPVINPETNELCNLGYIIDPGYRSDPAHRHLMQDESIPDKNDPESEKETIFHIQVRTESFNLPHLLPPGTYRLDLEVSCSNGKKADHKYELELTGKWFDDENRMLKDGIQIREVA